MRTDTSRPTPSAASDNASTGITAFDEILGGGLTRNRFYMVQGVPGSGKTTLAMQFLMEGVRVGESVLYVTLSETQEEILAVAESHGWSLEGVQILEVKPCDTNRQQQRWEVTYTRAGHYLIHQVENSRGLFWNWDYTHNQGIDFGSRQDQFTLRDVS